MGLGTVGSAMAVAVASARAGDGTPLFDVVGVDRTTPAGRERVAAVNRGRMPVASTDTRLADAALAARDRGNLRATTDPAVYATADVVVVDIALGAAGEGHRVDLGPFRDAIATLGRRMPPGSLLLVETTVPPGTCAMVAAPELAGRLRDRGLDPDAVLLAYSYQRVMPGPDYLDSIAAHWRVYAGHTPAAARRCRSFLSRVVDTGRFPLTELPSTTACETAKIVENGFRAVNIAFLEEWARFAEAVGVDLFEVVDAIRRRPTHRNLRRPGFGVGGHCLPNDPLLGSFAAGEFFGLELEFPLSAAAVAINRRMPLASLDRIAGLLDGDLAGKRLLVLGVSYRGDVADTRNSPAEPFVREARRRGAAVTCCDPLVGHWSETGEKVDAEPSAPDGFDAVVFTVRHRAYRQMDVLRWLGPSRPVVFDADDVLSAGTRRSLREAGVVVASRGRGAER